MKKTRISTGRYIPDPDKFEYYRDYVLENSGEKRTYEGYLAFKMKKMLEKEGEKKMKYEKYLVTYKETTRKRSIVIAKGEDEVVSRFQNNEDEKRETLEGIREIESIRHLKKEEPCQKQS